MKPTESFLAAAADAGIAFESGELDQLGLYLALLVEANETTNLTEPYFEYRQTAGGSITGGYVYRGCKMPDLHGEYFFADAVTGQAWHIPATGATTSTQVWSGQGFYELVSFGEDQTGELYITKLFSGEVWKMVPGG